MASEEQKFRAIAEEEKNKSDLAHNYSTYLENTNSDEQINKPTYTDLNKLDTSRIPEKELKEIQAKNELYLKQNGGKTPEQQEPDPMTYEDYITQQKQTFDEFMGRSDIGIQIKEKERDLELARQKALELEGVNYNLANQTTALNMQKARHALDQQQADFYGTNEHLGQYTDLNLRPTGMSQEAWSMYLSKTTPQERLMKGAFAESQHIRNVLDKNSEINRNEQYAYEQNYLNHKANLQKIFINDKYAKIKLDEYKSKLNDFVNIEIVKGSVDDSTFGPLFNNILAEDFDEGSYSNSYLDLATGSVARIIDGLIDPFAQMITGEELNILKNIFVGIGLHSGANSWQPHASGSNYSTASKTYLDLLNEEITYNGIDRIFQGVAEIVPLVANIAMTGGLIKGLGIAAKGAKLLQAGEAAWATGNKFVGFTQMALGKLLHNPDFLARLTYGAMLGGSNAVSSANARREMLGLEKTNILGVTGRDLVFGTMQGMIDAYGIKPVGMIGEKGLKLAVKATGRAFNATRGANRLGTARGLAVGGLIGVPAVGGALAAAGALEAVEELTNFILDAGATYGYDLSDLAMALFDDGIEGEVYRQQAAEITALAMGGSIGATGTRMGGNVIRNFFTQRNARNNPTETVRNINNEINQARSDLRQNIETVFGNMPDSGINREQGIKDADDSIGRVQRTFESNANNVGKVAGQEAKEAELQKSKLAMFIQKGILETSNSIDEANSNLKDFENAVNNQVGSVVLGETRSIGIANALTEYFRGNSQRRQQFFTWLGQQLNRRLDTQQSQDEVLDNMRDQNPINVQVAPGESDDGTQAKEFDESTAINKDNKIQEPSKKAEQDEANTKESLDANAGLNNSTLLDIQNTGLESGGITRGGNKQKTPKPEEQRKSAKNAKEKQNKTNYVKMAEILMANFEDIYNTNDKVVRASLENAINNILAVANGSEDLDIKTAIESGKALTLYALDHNTSAEINKGNPLGIFLPNEAMKLVHDMFSGLNGILKDLDDKELSNKDFESLKSLFAKIINNQLNFRDQNYIKGLEQLSNAQNKVHALKQELDALAKDLDNKDVNLTKTKIEKRRQEISNRIKEIKDEMSKYKKFIENMDDGNSRKELEAYYAKLAKTIYDLSKEMELYSKEFKKVTEKLKDIKYEDLRTNNRKGNLATFLSSIIKNSLEKIRNVANSIINTVIEEFNNKEEFEKVKTNAISMLELMSDTFSDIYNETKDLEDMINHFKNRFTQEELNSVYFANDGILPQITLGGFMNNQYHAALLKTLYNFDENTFIATLETNIINLAYSDDTSHQELKEQKLRDFLSFLFNKEDVDNTISYIKNNKSLSGGSTKLGQLLKNVNYDRSHLFQIVSAMMYAYSVNLGDAVTGSAGIHLPKDFKAVDTNFLSLMSSGIGFESGYNFEFDENIRNIIGNVLDDIPHRSQDQLKELAFIMMTHGGEKMGNMSIQSYSPKTVSNTTKIYEVFEKYDEGDLAEKLDEQTDESNIELREKIKNEIAKLDIWSDKITYEDKNAAINELLDNYKKKNEDGIPNGLNYFSIIKKVNELESPSKYKIKSIKGGKNVFKKSKGLDNSKNIVIIRNDKIGILEMIQNHEQSLKDKKREMEKNADRIISVVSKNYKGDELAKQTANTGKEINQDSISKMDYFYSPLLESATKISEKEYKEEQQKIVQGLNENVLEVNDIVYIPNYKIEEVEEEVKYTDKDGNEKTRINKYIRKIQDGYLKLTKDNASRLLSISGINQEEFHSNLGYMKEELETLKKSLSNIGENIAFINYFKDNPNTILYYDYTVQLSGRQQTKNSIFDPRTNKYIRYYFTNEQEYTNKDRSQVLDDISNDMFSEEYEALFNTFAEMLGFELTVIDDRFNFTPEQRQQIKDLIIGWLNNTDEANQFLQDFLNKESQEMNTKDEAFNNFFNANYLLQLNKANIQRPYYAALNTHLDGPASGSSQKAQAIKGNRYDTYTALGQSRLNEDPLNYMKKEQDKAKFKQEVKKAKAGEREPLTIGEIVESLKNDIPYGNVIYKLYEQLNQKNENGDITGLLKELEENGFNNPIISVLVDFLGIRSKNEVTDPAEFRTQLRDLAKTIIQPIGYGSHLQSFFKNTKSTEFMLTLANSVIKDISDNINKYEQEAIKIAEANSREKPNITDYLQAMKDDKNSPLKESTKEIINSLLSSKYFDKIEGRLGNTNIKQVIHDIFNDTTNVENSNFFLTNINYQIYSKMNANINNKKDKIKLFKAINNGLQHLPFNKNKKEFKKSLNKLLTQIQYKKKRLSDADILKKLNSKNSKFHNRLKNILISAGYIYYNNSKKKYELSSNNPTSIYDFVYTYKEYYNKISNQIKSTSNESYFATSVFNKATESVQGNIIYTENAKNTFKQIIDLGIKYKMIEAYEQVFRDFGKSEKLEKYRQIKDENYKLERYKEEFEEEFKDSPYDKSLAESMLQENFIQETTKLLDIFYSEGQGNITAGKEANTEEKTNFRRALQEASKNFATNIYSKLITSLDDKGKISTFTSLEEFKVVPTSVFPLIEHFNEALVVEDILRLINPNFTIFDAGILSQSDIRKYALLWNDGYMTRITMKFAGNVIKTLRTMVAPNTSNLSENFSNEIIELIANLTSQTVFITQNYSAHIKYWGKEAKTNAGIRIEDIKTNPKFRDHIIYNLEAISELSNGRIVFEETNDGGINVTINENEKIPKSVKFAIQNMLDSIPFVITNLDKFENGVVFNENIIISEKDSIDKQEKRFPINYYKYKKLKEKAEDNPNLLSESERELLERYDGIDLKSIFQILSNNRNLVNINIKKEKMEDKKELKNIHETAYKTEALADANYQIVFVNGTKKQIEEERARLESALLAQNINANIKINIANKVNGNIVFDGNDSINGKFLVINLKPESQEIEQKILIDYKENAIPSAIYNGFNLKTIDAKDNTNGEKYIQKANYRAVKNIEERLNYVSSFNQYPLDEIMQDYINDLKELDKKYALENLYKSLLALTKQKNNTNQLIPPSIILTPEIFSNIVSRNDFKDKNGNNVKFENIQTELLNMLAIALNREDNFNVSIEDVYNLTNINPNNSKEIKRVQRQNNKRQLFDELIKQQETFEEETEFDDMDAESVFNNPSEMSYFIDRFTNDSGEYIGPESRRERFNNMMNRYEEALQNDNEVEVEEEQQTKTEKPIEQEQSEEGPLDEDSNATESLAPTNEELSYNINEAISQSTDNQSINERSVNANARWGKTRRENIINQSKKVDRETAQKALDNYINSIDNGPISNLIKRILKMFMSVLPDNVEILIAPDRLMDQGGVISNGVTFTHTTNGVKKQYIVVKESEYFKNTDTLAHEIGHAAIGNAFKLANFKGLNNLMSKLRVLKGRVLKEVIKLNQTEEGKAILREMGLLDNNGNLNAIYDVLTRSDNMDEEFVMYFVTNAKRMEFLNTLSKETNVKTDKDGKVSVEPKHPILSTIAELLKTVAYILSLGTLFRDEISQEKTTFAEDLVNISTALADYRDTESARIAENSKINDIRDDINNAVKAVIDRLPLFNLLQNNEEWGYRVKGYTKKDYEKAKEDIRQRMNKYSLTINRDADDVLGYTGNVLKGLFNLVVSGFMLSPIHREVALEIMNEVFKATDNVILTEVRAIMRSLSIIDASNLSEIEKLVGQKTAIDKIVNSRVNIENQLIDEVFTNMFGQEKINKLNPEDLDKLRRSTSILFVTGMSSSPFVMRGIDEEYNNTFTDEFKDNLHTLFFGDYEDAQEKVQESMEKVKEEIVNIINTRIIKPRDKKAKTIKVSDLSDEAIQYFMRQTFILGNQRIVGGTTNQGLQNVSSILSTIYKKGDKSSEVISNKNLTKDGKFKLMDLYTSMVKNVESEEINSLNHNKNLEIALYNLTTKQAISAIKDEHPDEISHHYSRFNNMIENMSRVLEIKDEIPADFVNNALFLAKKFNTLHSTSLIKRIMRPTEDNKELYSKLIQERIKLKELYSEQKRDIDAIQKQKEKVDKLLQMVQSIRMVDEFMTNDFRRNYQRDVFETYEINDERKITSVRRLTRENIPDEKVIEEYYKSATNNESVTTFEQAIKYKVNRGHKIVDPRSSLPLTINENEEIEYIENGEKKKMKLDDYIKQSDNVDFIYDGTDISSDVTTAYLLLGNSFSNKGADLDSMVHYSEDKKYEISKTAIFNNNQERKDLFDDNMDKFKEKVYERLLQSDSSFRPIAESHNKFRTQLTRVKFENLTNVDTSIMSVLKQMTRSDMIKKTQEELNVNVIHSLIEDNVRIINSNDQKLKDDVNKRYGLIYTDDFEAQELTASERVIRASEKNKTALLAPNVLDQIQSYVKAYNEGVEESKKIKKLYVSPDILELVKGLQTKSISGLLTRNMSGKDSMLGGLFKNPKFVAKFEKFSQWVYEGINETKQNTVIINPKVLISNAVSQLLSLTALGISPKQIWDDFNIINDDIKRFESDTLELYQLQISREMLIKNNNYEDIEDNLKKLDKRIALVESQVKNNRVYYPMMNGADTNIMDETKQDNSLFTKEYKKVINTVLSKTELDKLVSKLGYNVDNLANELALSTTSKWYKFGQQVNRLTDMIPKIIAYENYKRQGLNNEQAMHKAQTMLINYNTPLESSLLRLLDRTGAIPFARYSVRALPALFKSFGDRPVDTGVALILSAFLEAKLTATVFGDFFGPSIYNDASTSLVNKIEEPFRTTLDLRNVFRHASFLSILD